jgi:CheY-like chemotaxis protein
MEDATMNPTGIADCPLRVLLVEDSAIQVALVETVISESPTLDLVHVAKDGAEAIAYLRRERDHGDAEIPDLILLDINMPHKDGFAVLSEMKTDASLCTIPVIMFTTSCNQEDISRSYASGANTFVAKPVTMNEMEEQLEQLADYWGRIAQLPTRAKIADLPTVRAVVENENYQTLPIVEAQLSTPAGTVVVTPKDGRTVENVLFEALEETRAGKLRKTA